MTTRQDVDQVLVLERELQMTSTRRNPARLRELLAPTFIEIGASGRRWDRGAILHQLAEEADLVDAEKISVFNLEARIVTDDVIQVFWDSYCAGQRARRTSLWQKNPGGWQQIYHQGTRT